MTRLGLFEGVGIEIESMIVDTRTLDVAPIADAVLDAHEPECRDDDAVEWTNELVLHVMEFKTNGPARSLDGLSDAFAEHARRADAIARERGARLLGTGAHPWMDPLTQTRLWPRDFNEVYEAYNRIFDCRGHGWSNLQAVHINLPFSGDEEFGRLHAAIRLVLPILPALAASSPILDGRDTGFLDARLDQYLKNQIRIPSVNGSVIPEPVFDEREYRRVILDPMYRDIAPYDPEGILRDEWLNSRGAIARFGRGSIEIRLLDAQECPAADFAIAALVVETVRALTNGTFASHARQRAFATDGLREIFLACVREADLATIDDEEYLALWGVEDDPCSAGEVWRTIADALEDLGVDAIRRERARLDVIFDRGTLARRIRRAALMEPTREHLHAVYGRVADCLVSGEMFVDA